MSELGSSAEWRLSADSMPKGDGQQPAPNLPFSEPGSNWISHNVSSHFIGWPEWARSQTGQLQMTIVQSCQTVRSVERVISRSAKLGRLVGHRMMEAALSITLWVNWAGSPNRYQWGRQGHTTISYQQ